jgi:4-hydroxy-4-methyl-2-oxoglutarate aldolase
LADRLERCYAGAVYDVLRELDRPHQVLPHGIRPLDPSRRLAGTVFTVAGSTTEDHDADETLLAWTGMLGAVPPGSVLVCQPNDRTLSHMGELSAQTLNHREVRGCVIDGGCRDSHFILKMGFPVFCRYLTPKDIVGRWMVESIGESISIGGIMITSGDYVLADRDGVVVIPRDCVADVVEATEELISQENAVRRAILSGVNPKQAYLDYGRF